jgi:hypothetical protein
MYLLVMFKKNYLYKSKGLNIINLVLLEYSLLSGSE